MIYIQDSELASCLTALDNYLVPTKFVVCNHR